MLLGISCFCCGGFTYTNSLGDNQPAENERKTLSVLMCFGYVSFQTMGFCQEIFGKHNTYIDIIGAKQLFSIFSFSFLLYGIKSHAQSKDKYNLCSQTGLSALLLFSGREVLIYRREVQGLYGSLGPFQ